MYQKTKNPAPKKGRGTFKEEELFLTNLTLTQVQVDILGSCCYSLLYQK